MKLLRITAIATIAICLAAPLMAGAQNYRKLDEIVAIVDEGVILRSELEATMQNVLNQIRQRGERQPPPQVLEQQVLDRLIMNQVQVQRAEQTGVRVTDQEVDRSLDDIARQNGLSLTQLRQAVEGDGIDFNEFREDVREQLLTSKLSQRIVESMDPVTDTEVDILMESDVFDSDEYHLSQIALQLSQSATPADMREAEQRIQEIRRKIVEEGMDFAEAATSFSDAPDALDGGEVGWRNLNAMPRQIADRIRGMEAGEISEPMLGNGSVMLIRVNERRPRSEVIINEYKARHLMVQPSELVSPAEARTLIEDLHQQIEEGADFATLAREFSDDERSANIGGLMDWFPEGAYGRTVQAVADSLEPGEVSQPFQTGDGWHIIKLLDQRRSDRTEEALRAEAREMIRQQRADEELDRVLRQMRDEAYVEILI
ncbi:MAG: peptidylprolyl isomerase [Candidatus Wenzhouxiangella sp. M2_3B_020]